MDRIAHSLYPLLYPLWLIAANLTARAGGMIILLILGHGFAANQLGYYFAMLAVVGLGVTAAQAGTGPLLIRLQQAGNLRWAIACVVLRAIISLGAILWIVVEMGTDTLSQYWPLLLMPITAALSPDWIISARTEFSRISVIAVMAQMVGIGMAAWAAHASNPDLLFAVAPAISVASLISSIIFAFNPAKDRTTEPPEHAALSQQSCFGMIGFTLLAGVLPNLDFVLLGSDTTLFLAQRIFLICAAFLAAISGALFAKQQPGHLRDIWLIAPMAAASLVLWIWPDGVAALIYTKPSDALITILQTGTLWPILLALLSRQILILQEHPSAMWVGWLCLCGMILSAALLPAPAEPSDILILMQVRLALVLALFYVSGLKYLRRALPS
ncbi:hypothetical protein [Thalassospira lucentensis]|uniref:hypothetical protein n=1 Tax=Thalassospira lucentensis TaxID=168935 RepID=UPI0003B4570A|nr:hypothetical protein [Thalassospira lucentensis]RCK29405.1 hypothetical protein TH1_05540 [Thalassospira lucentensis MCCC 1A00383 = DSM 14000]